LPKINLTLEKNQFEIHGMLKSKAVPFDNKVPEDY